jgi:nucleoside-diphosphate-sugar epimerase
VTLELAAEQVVELVGQGRIEVVDRDMDFPKRGRLSIERARTDLGYDPDFDFSEGLPMYVDWVRSNYDKLFRY